mmetsp:Transcript_68624/g.108865  ORF Transcript_68624/g.108865 Transcript_68624/m.108865 type:complete len:221 (-) Transcript_68624:119-781(-)
MSFCRSSVLRCNTKDTQYMLGDDKFRAQEELVVIIPTFSSDHPVDCLKGKFGPFRSGVAAKVPLWMALEMDKLQQCSIDIPDWMQIKNLKKMRDWETSNARFGEIPEHYIEIAFAFLFQSRTFAEDHQRDKSATLNLLRELVEARRAKIAQGMKSYETNVEMNITNMTAAERTCFRTRTFHAMDYFSDLAASKKVGQIDRPNGTQEDVEVLEESSSMPII